MALITEHELRKLAQISALKLEEHEVEPLRQSLDAVLSYASCLKDLAQQYTPEMSQLYTPTNVTGADVSRVCNEELVGLSAAHENNYFVVPVIVKQA